ncbi:MULTISPECIES: AAA family ATPase [unclassified Neisseria]|jgi:RecF/RecN/SMC N-terminal domain protein|uniref:AAA family ATPase n=1 Tax=unclassified Neisseria TaxID=2623750 RepID=UPI0008A61FA1|nr:AAA family ATPase [Neisseria sp. HMSC064E01]OFN88285.1 recombinase RecF [Neisseria sp. HMSC064E01]
MKINYLEIKGFKSIQNVELKDVSPFMVLAGANGTGKSNFVDALAFLSKVIDMGVSKAISEFGSIENLISPKHKAGDISYKIEFEIEKQIYQYEIMIALKNIASRVKEESLKILKSGEIIFDSDKIRKELEAKKESNTSDDLIGAGLLGALGGLIWGAMKDSDQIGQDIINGVATGIGLKLLTDEKYSSDDSFLRQNKEFQGLKNVKIFRIDPFTIKNRRSTGNNPGELNRDGSNIAAVLEKLEKDNELREQIIEWMSVIVPEMKKVSVRTQNIDSSKGLFFEEDSGNRFPAHMVSDGTIYALCLLVAVLTRVKQPGITIIEEPERGLHPKAISELIGFIREYASPHHPIILTTHSESVVRSLELEELYFVSKSQGKTQIKDVRKSGVDKNKIPLDTAWLTNLLGGGLPW